MKRQLAVVVVAFACGGENKPNHGAAPPLGGTTVAVVGTVAIDATLVRAVAEKNNQSPREALDALTADALASEGARALKLDARPDTRGAMHSALARTVAARVQRDALAQGPLTDAEVQNLTTKHWREVDVDEQIRAVHAVVLADPDPNKHAIAQVVANDLRASLGTAKDVDDFLARAKQIDARGLKIKAELLPAFVADGRMTESQGTLDAAFVQGARAVATGETSGVVSTPFGLHVIRVLERIPAKHLSLEERREHFFSEGVRDRGRVLYKALLASLQAAHPVTIDGSADALLESAQRVP